LKDRNEKYQAIDFVDIAAEDYSPEANAGIEWETAMDKIHAIEADGRVITGIEVFRRLYEVSVRYAGHASPVYAAHLLQPAHVHCLLRSPLLRCPNARGSVSLPGAILTLNPDPDRMCRWLGWAGCTASPRTR
jgi:hypothetical protein